MNIILYTPFCRFVGRELAKRLNIRGFQNPPERFLRKASKIIRWGFYHEIPSRVPQINSRESILSASSKLRALRTLKANGVSVPKLWIHDEAIRYGIQSENLILGRRFHHTGGTDIEIIDLKKQELSPSDYFTEYIKPHREWRVHVFSGEILFAQKKFFGEGKPEGIQGIVRSYANGWRFHRLKDLNNLPSNVKNSAISAVSALGLTFGAVDVISHGRDGDKRLATVLEVNTAPGLDTEANLESYVNAFNNWLRG